jgi:vanillate O-demethylase monooxygenase subunit
MFFMNNFDDPATLVDHWLTVSWRAPSLCTVASGVTLPGRAQKEGFGQVGLHLITPISERRTAYYFCHSRNFRVNDAEADKNARTWQQAALQDQDKPILEAVQSVMGDRKLEDMRPLMIHPDTAAMRARHALFALIEKQANQAAPPRIAENV